MRARLLHAALEVVAEKGSVAASIDDFVAHARVSRGTFYKYFPDVPSLVQAMAEAVSHELIAHLHPMGIPSKTRRKGSRWACSPCFRWLSACRL